MKEKCIRRTVWNGGDAMLTAVGSSFKGAAEGRARSHRRSLSPNQPWERGRQEGVLSLCH